MNKKADSKLISVYWFVILILVAGGIFLMVSTYYNAPYDVRKVEADILSNRVADCIYYNGQLNNELIDLKTGIFKPMFRDHFLESCDLNFKPTGQWQKVQYYSYVEFYESPNAKQSAWNLSAGNPNWKPDCDIKSKQYEKLVVCSEKEFYAPGFNGDLYLIKILSIVRKSEQNVK